MSSLPIAARLLPCVLLAAAALTAGLTAAKSSPRPEAAAKDFLETLRPEQKAQASFAYTDDERTNWIFVPRDDRKGVALWSLEPKQKDAALALLSSCLSAQGYQKVQTIRQLELVLRQMENAPTQYRNPDKYFVSIFGKPSSKGLWAWRFEGHHCSLNWTLQDGKIVASSPQFFGTNPARVPNGLPMAGTRVLSAEEDLGRALVQSLTDNQKGEALISPTAPPDVLTGNTRVAAIQEDKGIAYSALNAAQKKQLVGLIQTHADNQIPAVAKQRVAAIKKAGLDKVKFAWMGGVAVGAPHYYRIQGPTFLIEYDNTQNNANHIHDVWRDFQGDFGRSLTAESYGEDVLGEHYRADHTAKR